MRKKILLIFVFCIVCSTSAIFASDKEIKEERINLHEIAELVNNNITLTANNEQYTIDTEYDYPITPESSEWMELNSREEMMQVTQIPEDTLKKMTTEALVKTVLNHPLITTIMISYNDSTTAFRGFANDFNGARELLKRDDSAIYLVKLYLDSPILSTKQYHSRDGNKNYYLTKLDTLENILSLPDIYTKLNNDEFNALVVIAKEKNKDKLLSKELYGTMNPLSSLEKVAIDR